MSDSDSLEKTPEKEDVKSGPGPGSDGSKVRKDLFQKTREGRKKETIRSLRNAFLDVGQDEVDPKWEPVLAELTSLVASCSFNEEELKWKPLPPIDSTLSKEEKEEELKKRRYSEALRNCLLDDEWEDWIEIVEKALKWKEMRSHRKYYTYVLVDPRSHGPNGPKQTDFEAFIRGVFYIGKGCGDRCASHFFKEEPKGMCKNCSKTVDLDDDMKTIVHKCCKSPTFNSDSLCPKCGRKKADQDSEESSPHWCCGSGEYPKKAFQTCPHCEKRASVVDGKFGAHEVDEDCKGVKSQPTIGKCKVCKDDKCPLKDGKIHKHPCPGSSQHPEEGKCKVCKDDECPLKDGKIHKHRCPGSSQHPKEGKCKVCKGPLKDGEILEHPCPGSSQHPKEIWCVACLYSVSLKDGKIREHRCRGSSQHPKEGVCNICKKLKKLYVIDRRGQAVKGLLRPHRGQGKCERSGTAAEEGRSAIKDEKIKSIWEAGKTPIAVVCTQGDGTEEAEDKEAMMIIAYGTCNISTGDRNIEDYKRGKLVNKKSGTETRVKHLDDSAKEGCGLNLLIQAWKNYQSNGKPTCAAQIKWPSNPKKVKSRGDDEDNSEEDDSEEDEDDSKEAEADDEEAEDDDEEAEDDDEEAEDDDSMRM